jgi:hypothetical protein
LQNLDQFSKESFKIWKFGAIEGSVTGGEKEGDDV